MKICVVGVGRVGLVSCGGLAQLGHRVVGYDTRRDLVESLQAGQCPIVEPGLPEQLASGHTLGRLSFTVKIDEAVEEGDVILICVGTPASYDGMDASFLRDAVHRVAECMTRMKKYKMVVIRSTVLPGTTHDIVLPQLEAMLGPSGAGYGVAVNPEFMREGSAVRDFSNPSLLLVGAEARQSAEQVQDLYEGIPGRRLVTNIPTAEMVKYATNCIHSSLISLSNEFAEICEAVGKVDVQEVLEAARSACRIEIWSERGVMVPAISYYLSAGCGFGGSCLAKDLSALISFAEHRGIPTPLLSATLQVNRTRVDRLLEHLREGVGPLSGRQIAVLGLTFKPGTDDIRESPAIPLIDGLLREGCTVNVCDPVAHDKAEGLWKPEASPRVRGMPCLTDALRGSDAALLVTAWPEFLALTGEDLCREMRRPFIVDGRRALRAAAFPPPAVYRAVGMTS